MAKNTTKKAAFKDLFTTEWASDPESAAAKTFNYGKKKVPGIFTNKYKQNPNKFWKDLEQNTRYGYEEFMDRVNMTSEHAGMSMQGMKNMFSFGQGDHGGKGMPNDLRKGFNDEEGNVRWDRVEKFMDQMPGLMSGWGKSEDGQSQMVDTFNYFKQMSQNTPGDFDMTQMKDYLGGGEESSLNLWEETDSGPQFRGKEVLQKMHEYRKAFQDAGLNPEDTANLLGKATDVLGQFGDPGRRLVNKYLQESGGGEGNLSDRISMARDLVNTTHDITQHMDKMDIDPQRALGVAMELSNEERFNPDNLGVVEDLMEVTSNSNADVSRMLEKDESGQAQILSLMEALPGGDLKESSPMEMIKKRYYDEEGNLQKKKFQRDVEGFSNSYDNIMNLTQKHGDLLKEYGEDVGAGGSSAIVKQFVDEEGNVDWEAANSSMAFYDKMFNFLKENPDKKEQFDQLTKHGSGLKGVGFLQTAKDKLIEKAPDLFMDSEGNLRENAVSVSLTLASWGKKLYKKLFEEMDPMAWLGVAGAAATAISGLRFLFGGGGGQQQQPRRQVPVYRRSQAPRQVMPQRMAQPQPSQRYITRRRPSPEEDTGSGWRRHFD